MLVCMRTTINLPDGLGEAAKQRAAKEGRTFTSLVEEGLRAVLAAQARSGEARRLPEYGDPQGRFRVDIADGPALWEALDEERA